MRYSLRIATYNINGINRRLANLVAWLSQARPDVVCLQEIKCTNRDFPARELDLAGYGAIWNGQGVNHGVAILALGTTPIEARRSLPGDASDREARYLEAAVDGILIGCLYLPNGNPQPGPKFAYKLAWLERLIAHAAELRASNLPVVLAGDYNVVPTEADIYPSKSFYKDNALVQPEPRAAYARLLRQGWTDSIREKNPHDSMFTFWDYMRDSWHRDFGMRLDHLLISPSLRDRLVHADVARDERGKENTSDHAPAWIELRDAGLTS